MQGLAGVLYLNRRLGLLYSSKVFCCIDFSHIVQSSCFHQRKILQYGK